MHFAVLARLFRLAIHALTVDPAHFGDAKSLGVLIELTIAMLKMIPDALAMRGGLGMETSEARVDDPAQNFTRTLEFSGLAARFLTMIVERRPSAGAIFYGKRVDFVPALLNFLELSSPMASALRLYSIGLFRALAIGADFQFDLLYSKDQGKMLIAYVRAALFGASEEEAVVALDFIRSMIGTQKIMTSRLVKTASFFLEQAAPRLNDFSDQLLLATARLALAVNANPLGARSVKAEIGAALWLEADSFLARPSRGPAMLASKGMLLKAMVGAAVATGPMGAIAHELRDAIPSVKAKVPVKVASWKQFTVRAPDRVYGPNFILDTELLRMYGLDAAALAPISEWNVQMCQVDACQQVLSALVALTAESDNRVPFVVALPIFQRSLSPSFPLRFVELALQFAVWMVDGQVELDVTLFRDVAQWLGRVKGKVRPKFFALFQALLASAVFEVDVGASALVEQLLDSWKTPGAIACAAEIALKGGQHPAWLSRTDSQERLRVVLADVPLVPGLELLSVAMSVSDGARELVNERLLPPLAERTLADRTLESVIPAGDPIWAALLEFASILPQSSVFGRSIVGQRLDAIKAELTAEPKRAAAAFGFLSRMDLTDLAPVLGEQLRAVARTVAAEAESAASAPAKLFLESFAQGLGDEVEVDE
jgi:hypothetical protein